MIGIVIVTFNGKKWIEQCIKSIRGSSEKEYVLIIVDNSSQDNTTEIIKSHFPEIHLICNKHNMGFAAANNIGIRITLNHGCDYVFLLNQDTTIESDCISYLIRAAKENRFPAIFSPLQMCYDGSKIDEGLSNILGRSSEIITDLLNNTLKQTYQVNALIGASLFISRWTFENIGFLDELYFLYGEESDFLRRAVSSGVALQIVPYARINHWHSNIRGRSLFVRRMAQRSQLIYYLKDPMNSLLRQFIKVCYVTLGSCGKSFFKFKVLQTIWHLISSIEVLSKILYIQISRICDKKAILATKKKIEKMINEIENKRE